MLKSSKEGVILAVKVIPRAAKNSLVGWENEELKVRLNAIPEKGKANEELIRFLAQVWKLPKSCFSIESGDASRHKKLLIRGLDPKALLQIIENSLRSGL
jgi:uncharacterized protein (TIGR00251 family)